MHLIRNFFFSRGNAAHLKAKQRQKQENEKVLILYPKQPVSLILFSGCCFVVLFSFSLMDHQALQDWLHDMSTLPLDVEVLRHAQQLQNLFTKILPADIVAGEAKYTKSVFLHSSSTNLTCAWQMRGWNQTRRCYCLCWIVVAYILKISEVRQNVSVFSMPYFGQLYSSRLKDVGRTEVYVHTSRLREKILAAGSDLVSTHRGKEVVLVFSR